MTCFVDWVNVCLVCLQKGENRCVFQNDDDSGLPIAEKIMKCSDFIIDRGTDQPNNICLQCLKDLNVAYKFRLSCEQSNSIIKAILSKDNRELEVSGMRIKIPAALQVKKIHSQPLDSAVHSPINDDIVKQEDEDGKIVDECENMDTADYLENTDTLENETIDNYIDENDDEEEEEEDILHEEEPVIKKESCEKFVIIPEESEIKVIRKSKIKNKAEDQPKRGKGRPKKILTQSAETGTTYQLALIEKGRRTHEAKPQKICDICGNSYKYQHALNSHMRRHRNERPFNCEFCEKAFVSAVELRRHMRVHTGQKPYECQYCDRRFSDYGSRIKHERTHTGERPYVCTTCGKSFAYAHVLTVHMRTHTGEKKYICFQCGRGFTKKAYLDNHMAHHNTDAVNDMLFETSEAAATIVQQHEQKVETDEEYVVVPSLGRIKPKEEHCEDILIPENINIITHVSIPKTE